MLFNAIFILIIFQFLQILKIKINKFVYFKKLFIFLFFSFFLFVYPQQHGNQILIQQQISSTKICANSGRFMQSYCISDYNCNSERIFDKNDPSQIQVCIRGWCCSQTITPKSQVNVFLPKDQSCPKDTFNVELLCRNTEDCIRTAGISRNVFPILECGNQGFCCTSNRYKKPLQYGDICLNGGNAVGKKCQKIEDCQQNQNKENLSIQLFCIDDECCTQQQQQNIQSIGQSNVDQSIPENLPKQTLDEAQGNVANTRCPRGKFTGKYCSYITSDECGNPKTSFCFQGVCCSTDNIPDPGLDDFSRGTAICSIYKLAYIKRHCSTPLNCGFQNNNYLCISGYCCIQQELNNNSKKEKEFCSENFQFNSFMGKKCNVDSDCLPAYDIHTGSQIKIKCFGNNCCGENLDLNSGGKLDQPQNELIMKENIQAICYDGTPSNHSCNSPNDCDNEQQICVNNICCPKRNDFNQYACGGLQNIGLCDIQGICSVGICVSAKVCCECPYGQPQKQIYNCKEKNCEEGYFCSRSGFCCPQCKNGRIPIGSCYLGKCGTGSICQLGNICCEGII